MAKKYVTKPLHAGQRRVATKLTSADTKYNVVRCSRQFGKTYLAEQLLLYYSINDKWNKVGDAACINMWVSPTFGQAKLAFKSISTAIRETDVYEEINKTDLYIRLVNGVQIYFKGVDKADNIRGHAIGYMFCDEFAFYKEGVWKTVLRPMMNTQGKKAFFFSTPFGKHNDFYIMDMKGQMNDPMYTSTQALFDENPYYDRNEVEDARKTLPQGIFKQEYYAEYIDDGGEVFRNINKLATIKEWAEPVEDTRYYAGIDWAKHVDKSVLHIINDKGETVYVLSQSGKTYAEMIDKMVERLLPYNATVLAESNGIGDVLVEQLKDKYSNVMEFTMTNASKENLVGEGIKSLEEETVRLPHPEHYSATTKEMSIFTFEYLPVSRTIRYTHPKGMHDDEVIAWLLALWCKKEYGGAFEAEYTNYDYSKTRY